jgi:hypothetical protein
MDDVIDYVAKPLLGGRLRRGAGLAPAYTSRGGRLRQRGGGIFGSLGQAADSIGGLFGLGLKRRARR